MPCSGAFEQKLSAQFKCLAYARPPPQQLNIDRCIIQTVIMLVISKVDSRCAVGQFCYHPYIHMCRSWTKCEVKMAEKAWLINDLLFGFWGNFSHGTQRSG